MGRRRERRAVRRGSGRRYGRKRTDPDRVERCLGLCLLVCGFLVLLSFYRGILGPALSSVAELQVRTMINRSINEAVAEEFLSDDVNGTLMRVETAADGTVTMIQADMAAVNRMTARLTGKIQERVAQMGEERVSVPFGSVFGSQILSQMGPSLELRVIPAGTADVSFKTEFESSGITQPRHRIYLTVNSTARILAPFTLTRVETEQEILVAETVIVGDTPQSYVFVPEESILDGMDSSVEDENGYT